MTVHFVTAGMSLRTHSRCWAVDGGFPAGDVDGVANDRLSQQEAEGLETLRATVFDRLHPLQPDTNADDICNAHFRPNTWHANKGHLLSAELNTLVRLRQREIIKQGDAIHLLRGSATPVQRGATNHQVCALLLSILKQQTQSGGGLAGVRIDSSGPYELDVMKEDVFLDGAKRAWTKICNTACDVPVSLVLTGGYKALLIYLATRVAGSSRRTTIYYVYDADDAQLISFDIEHGEVVGVRTDF